MTTRRATTKQQLENTTLLLDLLALGMARFERGCHDQLIEFCFNGMRYSVSDRDYQKVVDIIGVARISDAIAMKQMGLTP